MVWQGIEILGSSSLRHVQPQLRAQRRVPAAVAGRALSRLRKLLLEPRRLRRPRRHQPEIQEDEDYARGELPPACAEAVGAAHCAGDCGTDRPSLENQWRGFAAGGRSLEK
jgi:hypothetical protein